MTDSSLVFLLGFGIQLLSLTNLGISMTSFMSDSSVDMKIFFNSKPSCKLIYWSRYSSSSRTFILGGFGQNIKPLESNDYTAECRGLLERLTTTLDFLFSTFVFLLKRRVRVFLTNVSSLESIGVVGLIPSLLNFASRFFENCMSSDFWISSRRRHMFVKSSVESCSSLVLNKSENICSRPFFWYEASSKRSFKSRVEHSNTIIS
jgi:hypothetical protein